MMQVNQALRVQLLDKVRAEGDYKERSVTQQVESVKVGGSATTGQASDPWTLPISGPA